MKRTLLGMAAATVVATGISASAATIAWWRFETDGGNPVANGQNAAQVDDSSGNGWHLSDYPSTNGVTYAANTNFPTESYDKTLPGWQYTSNDFVGSFSSGGLQNTDVGIAGAGAPFTIELFFRKTFHTTMNLFYTGNGSSPGALNAHINWGHSGGPVPTSIRWGLVGFADRNSNAAIVSSNQAYHLAVVRNGSTISLYLDGEIYDSFTSTAALLSGISIGNTYSSVGAFVGTMDEIRISDTALSPSQFLNAIPEPASGLLLALAGLLGLRRQRR